MKKTIIIAVALLLSAGVLSSQVKVNAGTSQAQAAAIQKSISTDKKDLASAD